MALSESRHMQNVNQIRYTKYSHQRGQYPLTKGIETDSSSVVNVQNIGVCNRFHLLYWGLWPQPAGYQL